MCWAQIDNTWFYWSIHIITVLFLHLPCWSREKICLSSCDYVLFIYVLIISAIRILKLYKKFNKGWGLIFGVD